MYCDAKRTFENEREIDMVSVKMGLLSNYIAQGEQS